MYSIKNISKSNSNHLHSHYAHRNISSHIVGVKITLLPKSSIWLKYSVNVQCLHAKTEIYLSMLAEIYAFSALTLLVGQQEGHPACKKTEWWGAGVVVCLEQGADLHTAQLMPPPLTVSCFSKIQIGFTFLAPAYPGSPRQRAIKRVCV